MLLPANVDHRLWNEDVTTAPHGATDYFVRALTGQSGAMIAGVSWACNWLEVDIQVFAAGPFR
jgi:hypothetical protein